MTQPFQHYEEATALLANNPGEYEIEKSKALATLALVAEQRTANLIAAYAAEVIVPATSRELSTAPAIAQHNDILNRLGLA